MKDTTLWSFWCEWDIGYEDCVFVSKDVCRSHIRNALKACGIEDTLEECEDEGLVGYNIVDVITE